MKRNEYHHLYNTTRWRKIREQQLRKEPLCEMCLQDRRIENATVCDHVEPHKGDVEKFYAGPFQSLCKVHHDSAKAIQESRGVLPGGDAAGRPIDPNHHWNK